MNSLILTRIASIDGQNANLHISNLSPMPTTRIVWIPYDKIFDVN